MIEPIRMIWILRQVRNHIKVKRYTYICLAISECMGSDKERHAAREYVNSLLEGYSSLQFWLLAENHITNDEIYKQPERLRATRLAWIDWMIAYWTEKGNKRKTKQTIKTKLRR